MINLDEYTEIDPLVVTDDDYLFFKKRRWRYIPFFYVTDKVKVSEIKRLD